MAMAQVLWAQEISISHNLIKETHLAMESPLPDASNQIVPFEAESPSSPHKKARQLPVENREMLQLIQTTISNSIEGHLGRIESSLATLVQDQSTQASRLTKLESFAVGQQKSLDEIQQSHTRRMDNLQAEIIQLQKCPGPLSAQSSPLGSPSSFRAAGPSDEPCFDLVLGGWKEGCSRETIQKEITSGLTSARLLADISEIKLLGKRPTFGKLILKHQDAMTTQEKRERQIHLRDHLRKTFESKGFWCSLDKPPKMRSISKAVTKLSGFLQQQCQVPKEQLDVGSWAQAKCFLGEHLVTGLAGSSQGSTVPNPSLLRWLIQDTRNDICVWVDISSLASALNQTTEDLIKLWDCHFTPQGSGPPNQPWSITTKRVSPRGIEEPQDRPPPLHAVGADAQSPPSTLFQYACWNIQAKRITQCIDTLLSSEIDIHILGLQEASIPDTDDTYDPQTSLQISSHEGYVILHAQPAGCFRRLALCLEEDSMTKWCASKTGYAHLLVQVWLTFLTAPLVVVVAHLPHSGRPFEDFEQACMDLQHDLRHYSMRRTPILLLGDMNVEIHSPEDASSRAVLLQSVLLDLDLLHFSADGAPTWKERRIDHILYNNPFINISSTIGPDTCRAPSLPPPSGKGGVPSNTDLAACTFTTLNLSKPSCTGTLWRCRTTPLESMHH